jgi:hypothetical protein
MSVAVVMNVHDGVILAADSASTLIVGLAATQPGAAPVGQVANVYNNANKIANLYKGLPIGCVTFGSGSIGSASISTLMKDFRKRLTEEKGFFDSEKYTIENVANQLGEFLMAEAASLPPAAPQPTLGMFLAGYSTNSRLGERWALNIQNGKAKPAIKLHQVEEAGINWGGEGGEAVSRLVLGFGTQLPNVLRNAVNPPQAVDQVLEILLPRLQAPIIFAPMPIQDAIELAEFLVHTAIQFSRFLPGPQVVGGPIEIAAITKHEGYKWIRRKHYYGVEFNKDSHREAYR